jgi:hypothetical protein
LHIAARMLAGGRWQRALLQAENAARALVTLARRRSPGRAWLHKKVKRRRPTKHTPSLVDPRRSHSSSTSSPPCKATAGATSGCVGTSLLLVARHKGLWWLDEGVRRHQSSKDLLCARTLPGKGRMGPHIAGTDLNRLYLEGRAYDEGKHARGMSTALVRLWITAWHFAAARIAASCGGARDMGR